MQKYYLIFIYCFVLVFVEGEAQINDVFNYANLSDNAAWRGNVSSFSIVDGRLRSESEIANDTFFIARSASHFSETEWRLALQLQFNTSSTNFVDYVLMADSANLRRAQQSYFVRIGNTADEVALYRKNAGQNPVKILDGRDNILNRSNNPLYVKVQRTSAGVWRLFVNEQGLEKPLTLEDTVVDNTHFNLPYCGIVVRQSTASFFRRHFFSLFYMGEPITDTIPPQVSGFELVGSDSIFINFNEELDSLFATQVSNFNILPDLGSFEVKLYPNLRSLGIKYENAFTNLNTYSLSLRNILDLEGNKIRDTVLTFRYVVPEGAERYDIVFHEIMATPTPVVGLPEFRYAELYNRSKKAINLSGFRLSDRTTTSTLGSFVLFPDSMIIICPTTAVNALRMFGTVMGVASFPSFNKTSDDLTLRNNNGIVIHSLSYTDAWYGSDVKKNGGYSLEMIDVSNPCGGRQNWTGSNHSSGGTPGNANSVAAANPDLFAPEVLQIIPISNKSLRIDFNEVVDSASAVRNQNYLLMPSNKSADTVIWISTSSVAVEWNTALDTNQMHVVRIKTIQDCAGNSKEAKDYAFGFPQKASQNDVIINEIMIRPNPSQGLPAFQYVELKNISKKIINLEGFEFADRTGRVALTSYLLYPDSFVILCSQAHANQFRSIASVLPVSSLPSLNQTSDDLYLRSPQGHLIHFVFYTDKWYKDNFKINGGFSLEMIDPNHPCVGEENWSASKSPVGGTPAKANSIKNTLKGVQVPELLHVYPLNPFLIELTFDKNIDSLSTLELSQYFMEEWQETPLAVVHAAFNKVVIEFASELLPGATYWLTVQGITNCAGGKMEKLSLPVGLPQTYARGDVLINEILFNPPTGTTEYVEVWNNSQKILDLRNLRLGNLFDDGSFREFVDIAPNGQLIFPGQFMCFSTSGRGICDFYDCKFPKNIVRIAKMPSYPQRIGGVVLADMSGRVIDSMLYDDKMHFKLLSDAKGVSLERFEYTTLATVRSNWSSASASSGYGTPGYVNSISKTATEAKAKLWLDYDVFSPDGDGYQDRLVLRFNLDKPGYVANVYIYNAKGSLEAHPIANFFLDTEGSLIWDGFYDNSNQRCPFGIYVLFFEAFHSDGSVVRKKIGFTLVGKG